MKKEFIKIVKKCCCIVLAVISIVSCASCNASSGTSSTNSSSNAPVEMKYFIEDGQTNYSVVIAENASKTEVFAAEEFVSFAEQVTGAVISIKRDDQVTYDANSKLVSIGKNKLFSRTGFKTDKEELNTDGFIIKSVGDMIFISGYYDRGTLYGTYEFIEKYFGVKFLTADATYIPQKEDVEIEATLNDLQAPVFEERQYWSGALVRDPLYVARTRQTWGSISDMEKYGGGSEDTCYSGNFHNTMEFLKTSPYFEANKDAWLNDAYNMICYTNGITDDGEVDTSYEESAVMAVIAEFKRRILSSAPTQKYFFIGQEDHNRPCNCSRCQESTEKNGNRAGMMLVWLNAISKELEKWSKEAIPDKEYNLCCFAYQWSETPPTKSDGKGGYVPFNDAVVTRDNVYVMYAPINACYYHTFDDATCRTNNATRAQLAGWDVVTENLWIWEYNINFNHEFWWFPSFGVYKSNFEAYAKAGVSLMRTQGGQHETTIHELYINQWVLSKLAWSLDYDVYDLIREFNYYYFEEAHVYMDAFVDLFETHFATLNIHTELFENTPAFLSAENYPLEMLQKAIELTEQAYAVIENSNRSVEEKAIFKKRCEKASLQPMYMIMKNITSYGYDETDRKDLFDEFFRIVNQFDNTGTAVAKLRTLYGY